MNKITYEFIDIVLDKASATAKVKSSNLPDGIITHCALVQSGNTDNEIIDFGLYRQNNEVLRGGDLRFSEKTANGNFLDSLRPVSGVDGGGSLEVRLTAKTDTRTNDVAVQVMLVIQSNPYIQ